ncbi:MAG TPA: amino acid permease [Planctomycetota bacterium]|nr:amino acid permease [Planctomycetota bacterium]
MNVPASGDLRRVIGFWGGTALIVGITIGSGIFRKPTTLAGLVPSPLLILGLWTAFGIISICGALAIAELSSMMPKTGGVYVYLRAAYGDSAAFVYGWVYLLVATPATVGALATFFAELFTGVFKLGPGHIPLIAAGTLIVLSAANLMGAQFGTWIGNVFTAIKIGALVMLAIVSFFLVDGSFGHLAALPGARVEGAKLGQAAASVIWAYDGWVAVSMITGEVVAAEKLMKRIIVAGMLTIVGLYLVANVGYFHAMSVGEMAQATAGVPQTIMGRVTEKGGLLIGACIMCSVFGALNGNVMTKPRVSYALSRDGLTFGFLGKAHPRWSTPYAAILIQAAVAIALVVGLSLADPKNPQGLFDKLTTYFVVVEWFALLFTVGAVMVLRRKLPAAERPFRTPAYPWVPLVFLLGTAAGLAAIVWGEWVAGNRSPVYGLLLSVIGFPVYALWKRLSRGSAPAPAGPA